MKIAIVTCLICALTAALKASELCVDKSPDCLMRKEQCNDPKRRQFNQRECAQTCGLCHPTTQPPTKTGTKTSCSKNSWNEWKTMQKMLNSQTCPVKESSQLRNEHWQFAWNLYSTLTSHLSGQRAKNVVFSPASVSILMTLIYEGADGDTAKQIERVVFNKLDKKDIERAYIGLLNNIDQRTANTDAQIYTGNMIYVDHKHKLKNEYKNMIENCYGARIAVTKIGPKLVPTVNNAVNDFTECSIPTLLGTRDIKSNMRMLLVNAIYFRALWEQPFEKVIKENFYVGKSRPTEVDFMMTKGTFPFLQTAKRRDGRGGFKIVGLPYKGNKQTMFIILPREKGGLKLLEKSLKFKQLFNKLDHLKQEEVTVFMPKFTAQTSVALVKYLEKMGLTSPFTPTADFGGMTETRKKRLFVSEVFHKAIIEVHEKGTVAAAATGAAFTNLKRLTTFMATHPFLILIRDNPTNSILFMGRVTDPSAVQ